MKKKCLKSNGNAMNWLVPENLSDIRPFKAFQKIFKHYSSSGRFSPISASKLSIPSGKWNTKKYSDYYSRFFILMNTMAVILTNREINSIIGTGAFRFGGHSKKWISGSAVFVRKWRRKKGHGLFHTRGVSPFVTHWYDSSYWQRVHHDRW